MNTKTFKRADTGAMLPAPTPASTPAPTPMPEPAGGWPRDAYTGKAGSYVRDPFTGIRRPAPGATPADGQ